VLQRGQQDGLQALRKRARAEHDLIHERVWRANPGGVDGAVSCPPSCAQSYEAQQLCHGGRLSHVALSRQAMQRYVPQRF